MHDNKSNNFYIKYFFIIFQITKLQRLFDTFVPLGIIFLVIFFPIIVSAEGKFKSMS
jgi:hypothetical protein